MRYRFLCNFNRTLKCYRNRQSRGLNMQKFIYKSAQCATHGQRETIENGVVNSIGLNNNDVL